MKRKVFSRIVCCILLLFGCTINKSNIESGNVVVRKEAQLSQQEKMDDFEYMYTILKENYPFFEVNKRLYGIDWLHDKEKYIKLVKETKNDDDFFDVMQKMMMDLHNGHTHMVSPPDYYVYKQLLKDEKIWFDHLNNEKSILRYKKWEGQMQEVLKKRYSESNNIRVEVLKKEKVAYLGINSFIDVTLEKDMKIIEPFLKSKKA